MKNKQQRHSEATVRQREYDSLTTVQKIKRLDDRLGVKQGARMERARLGLELIREANSQGEAVPGAGNQRPQKKNYQKPKKS